MSFRCLYCHSKYGNDATWDEPFSCECGSKYLMHFDQSLGSGVIEYAIGPNGEDLIHPNKYLSSEWGYVPHSNQIRMTCSKCGNGTFKTFAQAVNVEAPIWCFEHVCASCGQGYGIEVIRKEAKD